MIAWYTIRRLRTKPCPKCGKRLRNGSPECPNCEARLRWEGRDVFLAQ